MDKALVDLAFNGELFEWRGPSPYFFIRMSDEQSAAIRAVSAIVTYGWGVIPVTARIGETIWRTSLFPKDGRYLVPIKDAVRKSERLAEGDTVTVELIVGR